MSKLIIFLLSCFQFLALFKLTMQNILYSGCVNQFHKTYTVMKNYLERKGNLHCRASFITTSQSPYLVRHATVHNLWQQVTTYIKFSSSKAFVWLAWLEEWFVTERQLLFSYERLFFWLFKLIYCQLTLFNNFHLSGVVTVPWATPQKEKLLNFSSLEKKLFTHFVLK